MKAIFKTSETIIYALLQQIGNTNLFAGRKKEFDYFPGGYWDKGSCILVTAINLLTELKIDRKNNKKDVLISLVKYGLDQSEE